MLRKTHIRRPLSILLVVVGGMIMFFATETWIGILLLVLGVAIEIIGITLKQKS
jgi:hypothetical protein